MASKADSRKTALVTGTTLGGIGDAMAQELHARGFRVFAAARTPSKAQHLADIGLEVVQLDVVDSASIDAAVATVDKATGGKLDMLVNNAGYSHHSSLLDTDMADARAMFDVNVFGTLEVTQKFSPLLINAKGTVVNMGSIVGEQGFPFMGMYCASKAALKAMSRTMRLELSPFDVRVIHVVSGGVKNGFIAHGTKQTLSEQSPYYPIKDVVEPVLSGKAYAEAQYTTPASSARAIISNAVSWWPRDIFWYGDLAYPIFFISNFFWRRTWDFVLWVGGWPDMKKALANAKRQQ